MFIWGPRQGFVSAGLGLGSMGLVQDVGLGVGVEVRELSLKFAGLDNLDFQNSKKSKMKICH